METLESDAAVNCVAKRPSVRPLVVAPRIDVFNYSARAHTHTHTHDVCRCENQPRLLDFAKIAPLSLSSSAAAAA